MRWFLEKINKIGKPLAKFTKINTEKTQISKIRNELGDIRTDTNGIQKNHKNMFFKKSQLH